MPCERGTELSGLSFSPDTKNILVSTSNGVIRVVDAFNGQIIQTFTVSGPKSKSLSKAFSTIVKRTYRHHHAGHTAQTILVRIIFSTVCVYQRQPIQCYVFQGILTDRSEKQGLHLGCCFSPDSNFVLAGIYNSHILQKKFIVISSN